ncbi:MAG: geranylgeranyl diphosphate reductase [Chloroflexi bacterium AL-W]|nr:geranylgeranyl diphosphate reductase [Chloroflexi bacterium AL-N1]NOK70256.1 geranylgeranyl diphosphate reductase [Chloroflexi bacterium AL-N10]NOK77793.1 geranylgeranyl diphosphate reductase [Chloroflexi bacterium AL-N5]NOK84802.1 geranylgeranyl diphosphate reductase [Chloroflexi bacterium AL-W]NOK92409.1 geranylgeranyl diphosphate reductase [Chloroflexi bacterium AL-N15]
MDEVLIVGASVGGATAAETLARAGVPVIMLERDLSYIKPCGGAVPPVAFDEFDIPQAMISRKVHRTLVHSPSERVTEVEVAGLEASENDYVAMVCREDFDDYLRQRAVQSGAELIEGQFLDMQVDAHGVTVHYRERTTQTRQTLRVAAVIGADGAYSPTAKALGLPNLPRCIAIQERIRLPEDKMARWEDSADLYLGTEVSPDLYAWAFPKKDHIAVGIGAGPKHTKAARQLLENLKQRIAPDLVGGDIFMREAHALPMHPRRHMSFDRTMLIGDAAGLVVGTSGEGIYWAMKSGKMAAEVLAENISNPVQQALRHYDRQWWRQYGTMYRFLRGLQVWGYGNTRQKEVFTDMCRNLDVQRLTFESYMHKNMTPVPWLVQMRMTGDILAAQVRHYAPQMRRRVANATRNA